MDKLLLKIFRVVSYLQQKKLSLIANLINKVFIRLLFGCQLGVTTQIGKNVILGYGGLGVVIHARSVIGDNVNIGTGVTIGGTNNHFGVPLIGANTIISSGAKIIGPITIGKNCIIGANAVVLTDIPDNCVAVGVPAKVIKSNINIADY